MQSQPLAQMSTLRKLRELLNKEGSAQARLDDISRWVARQMIAEVCSIYMQTPAQAFELCATEGLAAESVHATSLHSGEGIVGHIAETAEPYQSSKAAEDPYFAFKPETGEEKLQSFLGVPLTRAGKVIGVITIQNEVPRHYSGEDIELLQTIAMVLSEFLVAEDFVNLLVKNQELGQQTLHVFGSPIVDAIALGHVFLRRKRLRVSQLVADDPAAELLRFEHALGKLDASIQRLGRWGSRLAQQETASILEAHRSIASDPAWRQRIAEGIRSGLTAEASVERELDALTLRFQRINNPVMRERVHDIEDLSNRLIRLMGGEDPENLNEDEVPPNPILVADTLGPAELLEYSSLGLRGLVLSEGSASSHTAIVARALGLAMISGVEPFSLGAETGQPIILDGNSGNIYLRPSADIETAYQEKVRFRARQQERYRAARDLPARTLDGVEIRLSISAGLLVEMGALEESGAAGIGLFRTELDFLIASRLPLRSAQEKLYRAVLDEAGTRQVIFRTLDIGGDKVLPYLRREREENPALGLRAIRLTLERKGLLKAQAQAMLRAAEGRKLEVMFPMVARLEEFVRARALFETERARMAGLGAGTAKQVSYGIMFEVPSLLYDLDRWLPEVDFVSVGSNDFYQYFWAADRGNQKVSEQYDELDPAFLRALKTLVGACQRHETPLSLCGEMASDPVKALALMGIGFRHFSMIPRMLGEIKEVIRSTAYADIEAEVAAAIAGERSAETLHEALRGYIPGKD